MGTFFSVGVEMDWRDDRWYARAHYAELGGHGQPSAVGGEVRSEYGNADPLVPARAVKNAVEQFGIQWGFEGATPFISFAGEGYGDYHYPPEWLLQLRNIAEEFGWETYERETDCAC